MTLFDLVDVGMVAFVIVLVWVYSPDTEPAVSTANLKVRYV